MNDGKRDLRPLFDPRSVDPRSVERSCEVGVSGSPVGLRVASASVGSTSSTAGEGDPRPSRVSGPWKHRLDLAELMARLSKHEPQLQLAA